MKHLYTFRNETQIVEFLDATPTLYDFLREVPSILESYFPSERLELEMCFDHEEEEYQVLFILIETEQAVDVAMDTLEKVEWAYWIKLPYEIRHATTITVDFI